MQIDRATLSSLLSSPVTYVRNATKIYDKKNSRIISRMRPIKEMIEHPPRAGLVSRNEGVLLLDEELFLALVFWGCSIASPSVQSATDLANRRHRDCGLTAKLSWNVTSFSRSQLLRVPLPLPSFLLRCIRGKTVFCLSRLSEMDSWYRVSDCTREWEFCDERS